MTLQAISSQKCLSGKFVSVLGLAVCASLLIAPQAAQAGLKIEPQIVELNAKQGQAQGSLTISNTDPNPLKTNAYAVPFTYDREAGFKELASSPNNLAPYLQLYPANITIPGSDKRRLRFAAKLAPNLPDGEYRAMVFTEMLPIKLTDEKSAGNEGVVVTTTIVPRMGVAVYVRKGDVSPNLSAESARFDAQKQEAQLLVKNAGKASAFVTGTWSLKQGDREIYRGELTNTTTVLAESDRYLKLPLPDAATAKLPAGQYELSGKLLWGFNQSREIPYKLSLTVGSKVAADVVKK
jgi:P pilus assembly chaperone PapD